MARVGLEQAFPNPAKRRAQRTRAQASIGVAEADLAVEAQNVRLETALAWIDLYYAKRRLAQPFTLNALAQDVRLDAACTHPKPEPGHDAISKLNLPGGRRLQACDPSVRQTNFVRHMYLLP